MTVKYTTGQKCSNEWEVGEMCILEVSKRRILLMFKNKLIKEETIFPMWKGPPKYNPRYLPGLAQPPERQHTDYQGGEKMLS